MSKFTFEQATEIENILIQLEFKINKMDCVLWDIVHMDYDLEREELKKVDLKINIVADYTELLRNDINKIYDLIKQKDAALNTCDDEELH